MGQLNGRRIFIIGGSGLGKSSFVKQVSKEFKLKIVPEAMREAEDNVWDMDFLSLQMYFSLKYAHRHEKADWGTVHDRCLVDTMLWGMFPHYNLQPFVDLFKETNIFGQEDVFVIAPTPSMEFYHKNSHIWLDNELRRRVYQNDFTRVYNRPDLVSDTEILKHARYKSKAVEFHSKKILNAVNSNVIQFEKNEFRADAYHHWQQVAISRLLNINEGH